ncbi:MAG: M23 family metallopeptidase [Flavisolibacter sp.]|jgi:murein DD-endopeptidase MepM/ murein hydrolase activator NlpD
MNHVLIWLCCVFPLCGFAQKNSSGIYTSDDSSFVYGLPYEKGTCHLLIQGYMTMFSHHGEYALDFKMKQGTKVCAARRGVVVEIKEDSHEGGLGKKYLSKGNHVIIRHEDGTYGHYWHLMPDGALVNVGDSVYRGEIIGLSGNTGFSAFPHLHFEVTTKSTPSQNQIPTYFQTKKSIRHLKSFHWYKAV